MAKNSFILYHDLREKIEDLNNEQVGELFRAILNYEIDGSLPNFADKEIKIAFKFIKVSLDGDREKYKEICEKNKQNARKRMIANASDGSYIQRPLAVATDTDTDSDTDIDNKKESVKEKGNSETSSLSPLEKKSKKEQYIELVQASSLSTKIQEQILEWLEYKKWKYAEVGIKSLLTTVTKNVDKYGESAVCAVIVESMGNMWQGICWDKLDRKEQRQERKEEAEYTVDGEYLVFKSGQRVLRANYEAWGRKDN